MPNKSQEIAKTKARLVARSQGVCEVEGCELPGNQIAHRIPQTKHNLKKYGKRVIHHPLNLRWVCGLAHNSAVDIRNHPEEIAALVAEIEEDLHAE